MIDHPYLRDPERRKAFDDLAANGAGNYREWAKRWSWTLPKVQRFVASLVRLGLATVRKSRWGTVVDTRYGTDTDPIRKSVPQPDTEPIRNRDGADTEPIRLGSKSTRSNYLEPRSGEIERPNDDYTARLVDGMNRELGRQFGEGFRRVMYDNRRSLRTIEHLKAAGVPIEFAEQELLQSCRLFNPDKHGSGKLPGTLGYFEKGILKAFRARAQGELRMLSLERGPKQPDSAEPACGKSSSSIEEPNRPHAPEKIGATAMQLYLAAQTDRPRREA